jgi:hypothetical protein
MDLEMLDPSEFYKTTDMGLAAYLRLCGATPQSILWVDRSCYWIFRVSPTLLRQAELYLAGSAQVEPRTYNTLYGLTKKEFFRQKDGRTDSHVAL